MQTLGDDETIARLATGIRRFKLPDEFNYVKVFQQVAASADGGNKLAALGYLASIFENRRQYPQAADYWLQCTRLSTVPAYRESLQQIVGNWGSFEPASTKPAGQATALEYRFRNGRNVQLTAREIDVAKLLDQIKAYLRSRPQQLDWQKLDINSVGYRLVEQKQRDLLGPEVAAWTVPLAPREKHFDKRVTISLPLSKAGAYLGDRPDARRQYQPRGGAGSPTPRSSRSPGRQELLLRGRRPRRPSYRPREPGILRLPAGLPRPEPFRDLAERLRRAQPTRPVR